MDSLHHRVSKAIEKLDSFDADLRYMGLCDIANMCSYRENDSQKQLREGHVHAVLRDNVLRLLSDENTEVQTQAVRTLGALVVYFKESEVAAALNKIIALPPHNIDGIKEAALRCVIANCTPTFALAHEIVLPVLYAESSPVSVESLNVLGELVSRFGLSSKEQTQAAIDRFQSLTISEDGLVRRRAIDVIAQIAPYLSEDQWENQIEFILSQDCQVAKLQLTLALCNSVPEKIRHSCVQRPHLDRHVLSIVYNSPPEADTELIETALATIREFVKIDTMERLPETSELATSLLLHNLDEYDDDDMIDGDGDDLDELEALVFEDNEDGSQSDLEDLNFSWKIRRMAARILKAIASKSPVYIIEYLDDIFSALWKEKEDSVISELLSILVTFSEHYNGDSLYNTLKEEDRFPLYDYLAKIVTNAALNLKLVGYLELLTAICKVSGLKENLPAVVKLAAERVRVHHYKQLPAAVDLVRAIADREAITFPELEHILLDGLKDLRYSVQKTSLDAVKTAQVNSLFSEVHRLAFNSGVFSIQASALEVCGSLVSVNAPQDLANQVINDMLQLIIDDATLRLVTVQAISEVQYVSLSKLTAERTFHVLAETLSISTRVSDKFLTTAVLRAVLLFLPGFLDLASLIIPAVLNAPQDAHTTEAKCEIFSLVPEREEIRAFAVDECQRGVGNENLVRLFGRLAAQSKDEARSLCEAVSLQEHTILSTEIFAEVVISGKLEMPNQEQSRWYFDIIRCLALRGVIRADYDELIKLAETNTDHAALGAAIGAVALASNQENRIPESFNPEHPLIWLNALNQLVQKHPYAWAWDILLKLTLEDENDRMLAAHIGGLLIVGHDDTSGLKNLPNQEKVLAVKYAFEVTTSDDLRARLVPILIGVTSGILETLESRVEATRVFNWAFQTHNEFMRSFGQEVLPTLYIATEIDLTKVRTVEIGPFKHRIDDGLPLRVAAYETIDSILCAYPEIFGPNANIGVSMEILDIIVRGLGDVYEVKLLACMMLDKLASLAINTLAPRLSEILDVFTTILNTRISDKSLKQDKEHHSELLNTVLSSARNLHDALASKHLRDPELEKIITHLQDSVRQ